MVSSQSRKLRILQVCISEAWGGLEQIAYRDAIEIAKKGIDVRFLCRSDSPLEEILKKQNDVTIVPISFFPRNYFDWKLKALFKREVYEHGVHVIHTHQPSLIGSITPWFLQQNEPIIVASRHITNQHQKNTLFHARFYRRLDALIALSQSMRHNLLKTHPLKERQVKLIHHGLDFERFAPEKGHREDKREQWGVDHQTLAIGLVGRIDPAKGQDVLLKAAAGLIQDQTISYHLKFVFVGEPTRGKQSEYETQLQKTVKQFGLEDHVVFSGFEEDIPSVMKALDAFVMPSYQEAFGLVAIEAMSMQTPVIISQGESAEEIVGADEECGLLVRPLDAFDLKKQLLELIHNPQKRKELGERGWQRVKKQYSLQNRIESTLSLYEWLYRRNFMARQKPL